MGASVEIKKSVPIVADVDVLVVGSGIAGATAAVNRREEPSHDDGPSIALAFLGEVQDQA